MARFARPHSDAPTPSCESWNMRTTAACGQIRSGMHTLSKCRYPTFPTPHIQRPCCGFHRTCRTHPITPIFPEKQAVHRVHNSVGFSTSRVHNCSRVGRPVWEICGKYAGAAERESTRYSHARNRLAPLPENRRHLCTPSTTPTTITRNNHRDCNVHILPVQCVSHTLSSGQ